MNDRQLVAFQAVVEKKGDTALKEKLKNLFKVENGNLVAHKNLEEMKNVEPLGFLGSIWNRVFNWRQVAVHLTDINAKVIHDPTVKWLYDKFKTEIKTGATTPTTLSVKDYSSAIEDYHLDDKGMPSPSSPKTETLALTHKADKVSFKDSPKTIASIDLFAEWVTSLKSYSSDQKNAIAEVVSTGKTDAQIPEGIKNSGMDLHEWLNPQSEEDKKAIYKLVFDKLTELTPVHFSNSKSDLASIDLFVNWVTQLSSYSPDHAGAIAELVSKGKTDTDIPKNIKGIAEDLHRRLNPKREDQDTLYKIISGKLTAAMPKEKASLERAAVDFANSFEDLNIQRTGTTVLREIADIAAGVKTPDQTQLLNPRYTNDKVKNQRKLATDFCKNHKDDKTMTPQDRSDYIYNTLLLKKDMMTTRRSEDERLRDGLFQEMGKRRK